MTTQNKFKDKEAVEGVLEDGKAFLKIAQKLREFERYETVKNLMDRCQYCLEPHISSETDASNKQIRITFIGNSSISEKRELIKSAFPDSMPIQVEHRLGATPEDIEYYSYCTAKGIRLTFINTPELNKWVDVNDTPDRNEWDTEGVVFIISGAEIDKTEKEYLDRIKFFFNSNALFFIQASETLPTNLKDENLRVISNILSSDTLSVKQENIHYFSSTDKCLASECLATEIEKKPQQYWLKLMVQKIQNHIVQLYKLFETKVDKYLKERSKYKDFCDKLQIIQDETAKKVNDIGTSTFKARLERAFPTEASYSNVMRPKVKELGELLRSEKVNVERLNKKTESLLKDCIEEWLEKLEEIMAEYFQVVSHVLNEAISEFENSYNCSYSLMPANLLPVNREMQVQTMSGFGKDFFKNNWAAIIIKSAPTSFFPASLAAKHGEAILTFLGLASLDPSGVLLVVAAVVVVVTLLAWANSEEKRMAAQGEAYAELEKDMKPFNYDVALAIKEQFGEITRFSQNALKSIFEEIRVAEQKRITVNNAYPEISAIDGSLLEHMRKNRESIEKIIKEYKISEVN